MMETWRVEPVMSKACESSEAEPRGLWLQGESFLYSLGPFNMFVRDWHEAVGGRILKFADHHI